jgi:hypothetical protein
VTGSAHCASRRSSLIGLTPRRHFSVAWTRNHAQFYQQLGKQPQELVRTALALLAKRFDLLDRE